MKDKLNIGCGRDTREGFANMDKIELEGVDVKHNIENPPYPFKESQFTYIIASNILEHIKNYEECIIELNRILKRGGILEIITPFNTETCGEFHVRFFSYRSFTSGGTTSLERNIYRNFSMEYRRIVFQKFPFFWNYLVEALVNIHYYTAVLYEKTFLRYLFPGYALRFKLKKKF